MDDTVGLFSFVVLFLILALSSVADIDQNFRSKFSWQAMNLTTTIILIKIILSRF